MRDMRLELGRAVTFLNGAPDTTGLPCDKLSNGDQGEYMRRYHLEYTRDRPWDFVSVMLAGTYLEHTPSGTVRYEAPHYPEPGEVGPGWITIDHADPRILICAELAVQIALGQEMQAAKLYTTCVCSPEFRPPHPHGHHLVGAKLEVRGRDRKVIYILREHLFDLDAYVAEWPD